MKKNFMVMKQKDGQIAKHFCGLFVNSFEEAKKEFTKMIVSDFIADTNGFYEYLDIDSIEMSEDRISGYTIPGWYKVIFNDIEPEFYLILSFINLENGIDSWYEDGCKWFVTPYDVTK